ncbi:N-acetyltransferase [Candidatus Microgenomates bacterium]|nr:N-acetyltransferase [Candidatus Microgenomates bacterium]
MPVDKTVKLGKDVKIPYPDLVNLYGCVLGDNVFVGPFVEIQKNVTIGKNSRVSSHSFICEGVTVGDNVFIAHGVMFINDLYDSPNTKNWVMKNTFIEDNVRIGSNVTILPVRIGKNSIIGAGAVVIRHVPDGAVVIGNPGRVLRK